MSLDAKTPIHVLVLPVELYHQIIHHLGVQDVFALRRTCKYFFALTQERGLWSTMFARMRATQALPCSRTEFSLMSPTQAERVLSAASKVESSFLQHREPIAHHIPAVNQPCSSMNAPGCSWRVLSFISDRFILSVDNTAVNIWDSTVLTSSSSAVASSPWAHFTLPNFIGYVDCCSALYIAISRVHTEEQSVVVYSIPLPPSDVTENNHGRLQWEGEFPLQHPSEWLKHMDPPSGRALLYFPPIEINIVHWNDGNRRSTIAVEPEQLDQWNGIISLRFCGPYILCFRARSVEAYPVPADSPTTSPLPVLRHRFGPLCFRAVSLSRVRVSHHPSGDVYTVFMLTNDIHQGMLHYHICVTTAPVPSMTVYVLAQGSISEPEPLPLIPGTDIRYMFENSISRRVFSTWSVGSGGLRGVWIDRKRGTTDRRVVAFTTHPSRLRGKGAVSLPPADASPSDSGAPPPMEGTVVHVISWCDLRVDITICAMSEWTGRIALGSRVGAISLL